MKMRSFAQNSKGFNLIIGSAYPLYQLTKKKFSPFFNIFDRINLLGLTNDEADELIKTPASEVGIYYSKDSINLIKELCGNKPFYIQVLCRKIFEKLKKQEVFSKNIIDTLIVESAMDDAIGNLNSHFCHIFENCTDYQKDLLQSVANMNNEKIKKLFSDNSKRIERIQLIQRGLIYKKEKEYIIDGLLKEWLLRW